VSDPENNKIIITADKYYNGISSKNEFKELFAGACGEMVEDYRCSGFMNQIILHIH